MNELYYIILISYNCISKIILLFCNSFQNVTKLKYIMIRYNNGETCAWYKEKKNINHKLKKKLRG